MHNTFSKANLKLIYMVHGVRQTGVSPQASGFAGCCAVTASAILTKTLLNAQHKETAEKETKTQCS